jgi:oligopeptide transport system substrate-binding protein
LRKLRLLVLAITLAVVGLALLACSSRNPGPEAVVTVPAAPAPAVETRIVEVTREVTVPVEIVVTATPEPTPAYTSPINAQTGTLVFPLSSDPVSLDPQVASDEVSQLVVQQLYEGLYHLRADGSTAPGAATDYVASPDSTVFTITLRSGMTWSDGTPVTAQNYVDGVCRLLDPSIGNPAYYLLTDVAAIKGAAAYASGDLADCKRIGVAAPDEHTLVITLERPAAFFPKLLTTPLFWPAPPASATGQPLTNGPFLLAEQAPGKHITLTKNPKYWNAAENSIERVELAIVPDVGQQLALYERGDLMVAGLPASETARIQADVALSSELHVLVQPGVSYLALNTQNSPTSDPAVRRALASAIDRQALIDQALKQSWHVPARAMIPPDVPGHRGTELQSGYAYNPEEARRLLQEAGYGPDKPVPPVELWYNREGNNEALFKAVAGMLEQAGIPVRLLTAPWDVYLNGLENCNKPARASAAKTPAECPYNAYRMGWVMDYPDPASMLAIFRPGSRFHYTGWQPAKGAEKGAQAGADPASQYASLLDQAAAQPDEAARIALYQQAEDVLLNEAIAIPLLYYDRTMLVKEGLDAAFPPFGVPDFQYWKLRE